MSDNKINTLCRIDQSIRGLNEDAHDDAYIPAQSENGALERINKSIQNLDIKGIKSGLPKVTNKDNGLILQVKSGKWAKGDKKLKSVGNEDFKLNYSTYEETDTLYLVNGGISEHFERVSENLTENTPSVAIAGPVTVPPRMVVINHEAWRAFHDDDEYGGWSTNYSEESSGGASYLEYKFETPAMIEYIDCKFKYENLSDGDAQAIPIKIFIETSEDGTTWTRHERPLVDHDFSPSYRPSIATNRYAGVYKAIRFVSINPMYVSGVACVSIGNIIFRGLVTNDDFNARSIWYQGFCYGEINTETGGTTELTEDDYNRLTTSEKNNGTLYLVNGHEGDVHTIPVSNDAIERYIENSSVCKDNVVGAAVESKYYGGVNIGNNFWFKTKIDLTNYSKFVYKLITGTAYSNINPSWFYTIGFMRAVPNTYWYGNSSNYVVSKSYNQTETIYDDEEIDVSKLTGEYYLCVCCHGWNAQLYDLGLSNVSGKNSIKRNSVEYANDLGSNNSNVLLFQGTGLSNPEQIVLSDNYTEYDLLVFRTIRIADNLEYKLDKVFNVNGLETGDNLQDFGWYADSNYWAYQIANGTTLNRISNGNNFYLTNIYGIKL